VKYYAIVNIKNSGGTCEASGDSIKVTGADELLVTVAINTDYKSPYDPEKLCRQQIDRGNSLPFNKLYQNHLTDFRNLFGRVSFSLNTPENLSEIPTDKRIAALVNGGSDPQLYTIFFQYGRYLLISGSRENSPLPMNLQVIWNDNKACHMSWTCDFHLDINVQQNYWPAEVCNLPESALPLASFVESLVEPGRETAKTVFGCNGWLTNTMVNAWGYTTPNWGFWGYFPEASSWIGSHLWEHYLFTQDQNFLRKRAYPVLKANAEFFLDYLRINPKNGYLMGPSVSPENSYLFNGKVITAANGPTVQSVLTYMLFSSCIESAWILKSDSAFREKLIKARDQLPPLKIGSKGQVQEWFEDFEEASPNHRHTSHLIALYPGSLINAETPELEKAATTTISNRMSRSDFEDVEWVRGNMVNFFARLRKGDEALNHLNVLFKKHCSSTFLSYSAAGIAGAEEEIFIIDGTTAGTAGVAEMLIQSHNGEIRLLPALPQAWSPGGSFSGLRARGGYTVDCSWKEGKVTSFKIKSETPSKTKVRINNETRDVISEKQ
jgi:alpha-L-fucosidase 2